MAFGMEAFYYRVPYLVEIRPIRTLFERLNEFNKESREHWERERGKRPVVGSVADVKAVEKLVISEGPQSEVEAQNPIQGLTETLQS